MEFGGETDQVGGPFELCKNSKEIQLHNVFRSDINLLEDTHRKIVLLALNTFASKGIKFDSEKETC